MILNFIIRNVARRGLRVRSTFQANHLRTLPISISSKHAETKSLYRVCQCQFHASSPKNALPPLLVLLVRYVVKASAIISGRMIRKWWSKLSPEEKTKVLNHIRSRSNKIACAGVICVGCLYLFYIEHVVEDPITKRRKFIFLNQKQINQIAEFEYVQQINRFKPFVIPSFHPVYRRVIRVVNNLLLSNKNLAEVQNKTWSVTVIDRPDITNAFALPHGKIFVFTGMLNVCTNDDQLAVVLAHEMAHSILCHVAESMSKQFFVDFILIIPTLIFWIIFPDAWAIFSEWIMSSLAKIFIHLPFSRSIEKEADFIGLQLAATSCYDVTEAPVFWGKMKVINAGAPVEWLSTHPTHESRQMDLEEFLPQALHIRQLSNCPPLRFKYKS